ncbi:fam-a protein [Plasmodium vinckei]|uniref:Fam-a protein n=1 Tax=Plasmodium vinckei TaxID=5860 RepID=A0A6V7T1X9_PLAVN|nr:fam-a protein [Plasmodium vinckei]
MNKFYIQFVLFLLIISLFVNNKVLATEPTPRKATKRQLKKYCPTEAIKLMNEAARHLEYHATIKNDYKYMGAYPDYNLNFYEKEHKDHIKVGKFQYIVRDTNKYNETIDEFWDPDCINFLDYKNTKRKIVRVYNPNLVMIQQRYKAWFLDREKYFYALAAKFNVSENKTIIAMTSANINDHNPSKKNIKTQ